VAFLIDEVPRPSSLVAYGGRVPPGRLQPAPGPTRISEKITGGRST